MAERRWVVDVSARSDVVHAKVLQNQVLHLAHVELGHPEWAVGRVTEAALGPMYARMTEQEMREQLARITPAQRAEFLRRLGEIQRGELPLLGPEALAQLMLRNPSVIERLPEIGPAIITAARQSPAALQQALTRITSAQRDEIMRLVSQMRLPDPGEFMQRLAQMRLFDLEALVQQVLRNPNVIEQIPQVGPAIVAAARQGPPALQQALTRLAPAQLADFLRRLRIGRQIDPTSPGRLGRGTPGGRGHGTRSESEFHG